MLTSFLDESYDRDMFAIGAVLSWKSQWPAIQHGWASVVRANHVRRFHATDCNGGYGEFANWPHSRRDGFRRKLAKVLTKHKAYAVFSGAILRDFLALSSQSAFDTPYMLCFQHCVQEIVRRSEALPATTKIDFVLDSTRFRGEVRECFDWMKFERQWEGRTRLGEISIASWQECTPLQCADLIAYESFKMLKNSMDPAKPEREVYKVIAAGIPIWGGHFEREGLERLLKTLEAKKKVSTDSA